jgi:hypothetical protein
MEALKIKEELFENNEFVNFLDGVLQKKLSNYNLELLIQCERKGITEDTTSAKITELKKIREEVISLKNLDKLENLIAIISDDQINTLKTNEVLQMVV